MEKDLKAQNLPSLAAIYIGTFLLMAMGQWGIGDFFAFTTQFTEQAVVMAAITVFGGILSNIFPNCVKHGFVFFRFHNVLPGHRCKKICQEDPRLSEEDLKDKWPEMFAQDMKESAQNAYWYNEIYKPVKNTHEVLQAHRHFLLYRDAASGLFIILIGLLAWCALASHFSLPAPWLLSLLLLVVVIFLLTQAGRQSGNRMVANAAAVGVMRDKENE